MLTEAFTGWLTGWVVQCVLSAMKSAEAAVSSRRRGGAVAGVRRRYLSYGWRISLLAACMAPASRRRWLDEIAETLHDFEPGQHQALLRNYRRHAVVVIVRSWTIDYVRSGASR